MPVDPLPQPQGHLAHVRAPQGLRRIAARYDKLATSFLAAIQLAEPSVPGLRVRSLAGRRMIDSARPR
jgi:hypothetical protein